VDVTGPNEGLGQGTTRGRGSGGCSGDGGDSVAAEEKAGLAGRQRVKRYLNEINIMATK